MLIEMIFLQLLLVIDSNDFIENLNLSLCNSFRITRVTRIIFKTNHRRTRVSIARKHTSTGGNITCFTCPGRARTLSAHT